MLHHSKLIAFSAIALSVSAFGTYGARAASLITNGSFETPIIGYSWYENYGTNAGDPNYGGASFDSAWQISAGTNVDIVSSLTAPGNAPTADGGKQYLDLVGVGSTGGVSQTFSVAANSTYQLSFSFANNPWSTSTASADVTVVDSSGQILFQAVTHSGSTQSNLDWTVGGGTFLTSATSTSATLSFSTTVGNNSGGILLDAVDVSGPPGAGATPLPAAWIMMASGLGGLGFVARRRRKKTSPAAI